MSRTSETTSGQLRCSNPDCKKVIAKEDGIKCRCCGTVTEIPVHFYPGSAIGGGSIATDWERHRQWARVHGCPTCGIAAEPASQHPASPDTSSQPSVAAPEPEFTGSHLLAARYLRVPSDRVLIGTDYKLPEFPPADPAFLAGARVLVLCADGPELPEIHVPIEYLRERGAHVVLAGQDWIFQWRKEAPGHIVIAEWLSDKIMVPANVRMSDVRLEDFDAVFIPGGAWNPDMLRTDDVALRLVRQAHALGLLVVSLCHGPQVVISAAFDAPEGQQNFPTEVNGERVHITGVGSIRRDLKNAGFLVHDNDPTVYDEGARLLTARDPNDLGPLCEKMGELLKQRLSARKS